MNDPRGPIAILGVGNVLLGDDGVGVDVVREIARRVASGETTVPAETDLVDGGTLGLRLLPLVSGARALVIVDAAEVGEAPGDVRVVSGASIGSCGIRVSAGADAGIGELVDVARLLGTLPPGVSLVGIRPAALEAGLGLSPAVQATLDEAVRAVLEEARRLDVQTSSAMARQPDDRDLVGAPA